MAKEKKLTAAKVRKKIWVPMYAPESYNNAFIGETHVYELPEAVGKFVTVNMMVLTNDPKKQFAEMRFEIISTQDGKCIAEPRAYMMTASAVKRLMRRRNDKVNDSWPFITADAKRVRIKYFLLARASTSGSIRADLRNETRELLAKTIRKITMETLLKDVVSYKFQSYIRDTVSRVFPIASCDIKFVGSESAKQTEKGQEQIAESEYFEKSEEPRPRKSKFRSQDSEETQAEEQTAEIAEEETAEPAEEEKVEEKAEE